MGSKKKASIQKYKPPYKSNKKQFSYLGVIFERSSEYGSDAIIMCHWPRCGMDKKTAKRFGEWLIKRSEEM